MALTGYQFNQIQQPLLDGYDEATLRRMVRINLGVELNHVAGGDNDTDVVYNLIAWADREHRVHELIAAAAKDNPTNAALQALQQEAQTWHLAPPTGEDEPEPYKGLDYFDVADADLFFGRDRLTAELVGYLYDHTLLAVVGASGSGKSSVVRAGVIPALRTGKHLHPEDRRPRGSEHWPIHIITPTAHPLKELAASLTRNSESVTAQATLMDDLATDVRALDLFVSRQLAHVNEGSAGAKRLLLIVDQFEELFTLCRDRGEQKSFVDNLLTAASLDNKTTVILTLRADFYAHCAQFDNLRQALESCQRYIGAMSEDELRQAIEEPAAQGGWDLEPGLVDLMLADVAKEPGALPLLSHALRETWKRRRGRTLTFGSYQAAGRIQGAIANTADEILNGFTPDQTRIARNIFLRLTELGEGVQDTRRRVRIEEIVPELDTASEIMTVLQVLQDARLITTVRREQSVVTSPKGLEDVTTVDAETFVDVAHEALIREWPALREWLADDREGLRLHRQLTEATQEWEGLNRDTGILYRGLRLEQVQAWDRDHPDGMNDLEQEFFRASLALVEAERAEQARISQEREDARQQREEARERELESAKALALQQTRARNRLRWGLAAVVLALIVAVVATWIISGQNESLEVARATVEANLELANQQLAALEVERLLQQAREAKAAGDTLGAIVAFEAAAQADPSLEVDLEAEIADVRRQVAAQLVQKGEALAREGDLAAAHEKFKQALALDPPPDTPVYVYVPEGEFVMGSIETDSDTFSSEFPQHTVNVDAYWIMRTEVTNAQYQRCVEAGVCVPPGNSRWNQAQFAKQPVTDVGWYQAAAYAAWVGGRLPTEAEWEKACRGGVEIPVNAMMGWGEVQQNPNADRIYPWGADFDSSLLNSFETGWSTWADVGSYPGGISPHGIYDMAGNVVEWTSSLWGEDWEKPEFGYPYNPDDGRENVDVPGSVRRVLRGGSFASGRQGVRCAFRYIGDPGNGFNDIGFRVLSPGY